MQLGVLVHLAAAASRDADLWLKLRRLVRDRRGDHLDVKWMKAHRSREAAARLELRLFAIGQAIAQRMNWRRQPQLGTRMSAV